jgi:hypothetical protein
MDWLGRVRWRNVACLALVVAAGMLILTGGGGSRSLGEPSGHTGKATGLPAGGAPRGADATAQGLEAGPRKGHARPRRGSEAGTRKRPWAITRPWAKKGSRGIPEPQTAAERLGRRRHGRGRTGRRRGRAGREPSDYDARSVQGGLPPPAPPPPPPAPSAPLSPRPSSGGVDAPPATVQEPAPQRPAPPRSGAPSPGPRTGEFTPDPVPNVPDP